MRDSALANLNFRDILDYGGQPQVQNRYAQPLTCRGYCVDCEESGVLRASGGKLTLMSHGCDSADFETILGPMRRTDAGVTAPVLFLLENPGADDRYRNGVEVAFRGFAKKPPVNHYYWTPSARPWPQHIVDFIADPHFYGPYFAYLMQHHQLLNVYITNLVKCKWTKVNAGPDHTADPSLVTRHCAQRYLTRELALFAPRLVICFGENARRGFVEYSRRFSPEAVVVGLFHPAYIKNRSQTDLQRRSKEQLFEENDVRIEAGLARLG